MSISLLIKDFFLRELTERVYALSMEVRKMSQAINDRIDQMEAAATAERAEVEAALQALRDEIAAGRLNEAQIIQRLDDGIQKVKDIHTAAAPPEPPVEPTPVS